MTTLLRRSSCYHLAAPRCRRRPPTWPGHRSRRPNKRRRKTGTYTALPVATRWPPCRRRHPWSHLSRRRARPSCRHMMQNMILSQPGAWSAEPSGLLPGTWNHCSSSPRIMPLRPGGHGGSRWVAPSAPGAASWWSRWMPHPSAPRRWPQVDHGRMPRGLIRHGTSRGGLTDFSSKGPHILEVLN